MNSPAPTLAPTPANPSDFLSTIAEYFQAVFRTDSRMFLERLLRREYNNIHSNHARSRVNELCVSLYKKILLMHELLY